MTPRREIKTKTPYRPTFLMKSYWYFKALSSTHFLVLSDTYTSVQVQIKGKIQLPSYVKFYEKGVDVRRSQKVSHGIFRKEIYRKTKQDSIHSRLESLLKASSAFPVDSPILAIFRTSTCLLNFFSTPDGPRWKYRYS